MKESQLLNRTLDLVDDNGTYEAYNYLVKNKYLLDVISSQVYNFLYCLAATSNKNDEALDWLEEAIITKKMWYRSEVFEDEDLDGIREDIRFKSCYKLSEERYIEALKDTKSVCTWSQKKSDGLILSLHGNQQNNEINKVNWNDLDSEEYQVEYVQSEELDSYQLFRWEDDGTGSNQLKEAIDLIEWTNYKRKILCGFSAGCNVILKAVRDTEINCDKIIMQSPWIPAVDDNLNDLVDKLKKKNIEILIICGEDDEDCLSQCNKLEAKAVESKINIKVFYIEGLGHDYPKNFSEIVLDFIKQDDGYFY